MISTTLTLTDKYKNYSNILCKIKRDVDNEHLIRLNRGLYESDKNTNPIFIAQAIVPNSYISFDYALSRYGLIPEKVFSVTCASFNNKKDKTFSNYFGTFRYSDIPNRVFHLGLMLVQDGEYACRFASKEKAICDSLFKWPKVRSIKDLKILMFEDKRIDEEEFSNCDFNSLIEIASAYKRTNHDLLIKMIKKEYLHG